MRTTCDQSRPTFRRSCPTNFSRKVPSRSEIAGKQAGPVELRPPVLLEGEDEALYNRLLAQVAAAVDQAHIIEEFWARDVVDLMWKGLHLRRLRFNLLIACPAPNLVACSRGE